MEKEVIRTDLAPKAIGPYSQAVRIGGTIYCSGQIAIDPSTGQLVSGGVQEQTDRCLKNLSEVLKAAGFSLDDVVKTTVFMKDLNVFGQMNEVYSRYFGKSMPARSTIEVNRLPRDTLIEIEAIAVKG